MRSLQKRPRRFSFRERLLLLIFLSVFLGCTAWLVIYHADAVQNETKMEHLREQVYTDAVSQQPAASLSAVPNSSSSQPRVSFASSAPAVSSAAAVHAVRTIPQFQKLRAVNPDIRAWVQIEGTKINYPVMQTPKDPEYYLHRNLEKRPESRGLPFLDAKSDLKTSRNYLVYGHNMRDGTAFSGLRGYLSAQFYQEHPIIHFDTQSGRGDYQIIAVLRSRIYPADSKAFKYYAYASLHGKSAFQAYVRNVKQQELYATGHTAVYGDQLLTLSTCYRYVPDGRLAVIAKKVK